MNVKFNLDEALTTVEDTSYKNTLEQARRALVQLDEKTGAGPEWLGWIDMIKKPDDALLERIDRHAAEIRSNADVFIVCGIGGSYLGAKAVIDALGPFFNEKGPDIYYAGHHMSGKYLEQLIRRLEQPKEDGEAKQVYLNVISKSGTTMETALAFRVLRDWIHRRFPEDAKSRIICTTSATGGALNKVIEGNGYAKYVIPDDVGGRFSVLTPVGLLPIAVAGIDIRSIFYGAVDANGKGREQVLEYAACRSCLYRKGYAIDIIASFEPELASFGGWIQQLYGESEGKNGKGMFPVTLGYSTDLHSVGQMVQQGQRNLIETFIEVQKAPSKLAISEDADNHDGLNYLAGKSFHEINTKALEGTRKAHIDGDVPVITISLNALNAQSIGELIFSLELATGVYVYLLGENPFDQPGVEDYKRNMYKLLGKPGS